MTNPLRKMITPVLALACLAALALPLAAQIAAPAATQDKPVDMKKLIAEIVGDYEFQAQGQILLVTFSEQDGKLFGAPPGETPEEIHPVEGKPLCFDVTLADSGDYYELQFVRNDKGVLDKCIMSVQGMVVEGAKVIK
jgi:hypothetical protein